MTWMYYKQQKAEWGLGTRLHLLKPSHVRQRWRLYILLESLSGQYSLTAEC